MVAHGSKAHGLLDSDGRGLDANTSNSSRFRGSSSKAQLIMRRVTSAPRQCQRVVAGSESIPQKVERCDELLGEIEWQQ